jgi:hypothetical protein
MINGNQRFNDTSNVFKNLFDDLEKSSHNKVRKIYEVLKSQLSTTKKIPVSLPSTGSMKDQKRAKFTNDVIRDI